MPVDFVSIHGYADDTVQNLFGTNEDIPMDDRVCRAIAKVRGQIKAASTPDLPLFWTEWNVQGMNEVARYDLCRAGSCEHRAQCDGQSTMMSFWTFSDVFEEGGPIPKPFEGEFGLRAKGGINKPSYYGFALLHQLGERRLTNPSKNVIVTKNPAGEVVIAAWNLVDPGQHGDMQTMQLIFQGVSSDANVILQRVDSTTATCCLDTPPWASRSIRPRPRWNN